jgi:hypothetical protein
MHEKCYCEANKSGPLLLPYQTKCENPVIEENCPFCLQQRCAKCKTEKFTRKRNPRTEYTEYRRGLQSIINGKVGVAIADTGAARNILSYQYAAILGLDVYRFSSSFKLGNSREIKSIGNRNPIMSAKADKLTVCTLGTVSITLAFKADTSETYEIVCHVLPQFIFPLILGRVFLEFTETLSKHRHRFSAFVPVLVRRPSFVWGFAGILVSD